MKTIRTILGTWQLRVLEAAVSLWAAGHHHRKTGPVDMCTIVIWENSAKSTIFHDGTQASGQLHAAVMAASI
ncbi:hypothetical protein AXW67_12855 [Bradyrhizobium neotropicale]|uniref:Uncharacterized protein n=1 Tax=Bradyrhizobium neotropicale TaxID=1497615 RepID=A0A176Z8S9_9BRAD|nr:hypothetical protein AXW67_12855 [Bradyrhizobium neotropicale]